MTMDITILGIILSMLVFLVFVVELVMIVGEIIENKKLTIIANYLIFNDAVLLMMYVRIHEALLTDDIFMNGGYLLFFIVLCFVLYMLLYMLRAYIKSLLESGHA